MLQGFLRRMAFGTAYRVGMYDMFEQLLANKVPLDRAIALLQEQEIRRSGRRSTRNKVFRYWRQKLDDGVNFGVAVRGILPESEAMIIEAGAQTDRLGECFGYARQMVEGNQRILGAIVASTAYPVALFVSSGLALYGAAIELIPNVATVLPLDQWVGLAAIMAAISIYLRDFGTETVIGILTVIGLIALSMPRLTAQVRIKLDRIPPWSLYRLYQGAAFLLAISALQASGVRIDGIILDRIGKGRSPWLTQRIRALRKQIISGETKANLGEAMKSTGYGFPDPDLNDQIAVYATLPKFEEALLRLTMRWLDTSEKTVKQNMRLVFYAALCSVAFVIILLLSSIFGIMEQVQKAASSVT